MNIRRRWAVVLCIPMLVGCTPSGKAAKALLRGNSFCGRDLDRAIVEYDAAIRDNPKYADAYCMRAIAYADKGDHEKAIADYVEAIRLNPKYADAYCMRGVAYPAKRANETRPSPTTTRPYGFLDPQYAHAYSMQRLRLHRKRRLGSGYR